MARLCDTSGQLAFDSVGLVRLNDDSDWFFQPCSLIVLTRRPSFK